jgi:hypothetical protein
MAERTNATVSKVSWAHPTAWAAVGFTRPELGLLSLGPGAVGVGWPEIVDSIMDHAAGNYDERECFLGAARSVVAARGGSPRRPATGRQLRLRWRNL